MKLIKLQPSEFTDQVKDGHEMTKLPYPFYAREDGGIENQDLWQGDPFRVIGFQKDLARHVIDLWWDDALNGLSMVIGMYLVTADSKGNYGVHQTAISSAEVIGKEGS